MNQSGVQREDIARCLNIVISKIFGNNIHKLSTTKFFVKSARASLLNRHHKASNQLELIRGYFYSLKPGMGNIILNFNISTSAVFRPIGLDDFLYRNNTFDCDKPEKVESILKGEFVYLKLDRKDKDPAKQKILNSDKSRYWRILEVQPASTGNIEDLTFEREVTSAKTANGLPVMETIRVVDHLCQVSATGQIPMTGRPAVNVGSRNKPIWYALEHLQLVPYQPYIRLVPDDYASSMVDQACRDPGISRALIENEGLANMGFTTGGDEAGFGSNVPVMLVPMMLQVPHQVLPMPRARYSTWNKTGDIAASPQSHWKFPLAANRFLHGSTKNELRYAIILGPGVDLKDLSEYEWRLREQFEKCNLFLENCKRIPENIFNPILGSASEASIKAKLKDLTSKGRNVDMVFLLLKAPDNDIYRDFKNAADRVFPIQSICMTLKDLKKVREGKRANMIREINTNIMMKVNLKLGGVNHRIDGVSRWLKNTMVVGADLVHPGPGAFPGTPSIAAVVGSVDEDGGKCLGSLRLQDIHKTDREIIDTASLEEMMLDRLASWAEHHEGSLPDNVIYYRDGVSSGHYKEVQSRELNAITEAYRLARLSRNKPEQTLNLTAVIVTKRHHTRFYPQTPAQGDKWGNNNTHTGTCVDTLVTSPYYQDFFLQSHSGIKGTAQPTRYFILKNSIPHMTPTTLRDLTHNLCYSPARSTSAVSYTPPTFYADRLCERGRLYLRRFFTGDDDALKRTLLVARAAKASAQKLARERVYGNGSVKTGAELLSEKSETRVLDRFLADTTFGVVEEAFYGPSKVPGWRNPYAWVLRDSMFWM